MKLKYKIKVSQFEVGIVYIEKYHNVVVLSFFFCKKQQV